MLIDLDVTIAYKCFSCGAFEFADINLFKLFQHESIKSCCKCGESAMEIQESGINEYKMSVPCMSCGSRHSHIISREGLLGKNITVYTCPITGIKNCFIGKDDSVRKFIDSFEKELDGIIDEFGYDNYFENTQVMMDTINKIHDIAEKGHLRCECGCDDIIVSMLRKGIILKCSQCSRCKFIPASNNNDLKRTLQRERIILFARKSKYKYQTEV